MILTGWSEPAIFRITSYNVCYTKLLRVGKVTPKGETQLTPVITSYSIHYTKLYDSGFEKSVQRTLQDRIRLEDAIKAKKLKDALNEMAEEGVVQLFSPIDGTQPIVGVIVV